MSCPSEREVHAVSDRWCVLGHAGEAACGEWPGPRLLCVPCPCGSSCLAQLIRCNHQKYQQCLSLNHKCPVCPDSHRASQLAQPQRGEWPDLHVLLSSGSPGAKCWVPGKKHASSDWGALKGWGQKTALCACPLFSLNQMNFRVGADLYNVGSLAFKCSFEVGWVWGEMGQEWRFSFFFFFCQLFRDQSH